MSKLSPADVLEVNNRGAFATGPQDDVLELRRFGQPALGRDCKGLLHRFARGGLANAANRELLVLVGHRFLHIGSRNPQLGHPVGFQPDSHGIVGCPENTGLVGAGNALDRIQQIEVGVVGYIGGVVAVIGGIHRDDHHEGR